MEQLQEIKLYEDSNENNIRIVIGILEDNEIEYIRRDSGSGSYMNLYMGESIQTKSIWVKKKDIEKAQALIDIVNQGMPEELEEVEQQEDENYYYKRKRTLSNILAIIFIGIPFIVIMIAIILSLF